jgi:hypothetical protein
MIGLNKLNIKNFYPLPKLTTTNSSIKIYLNKALKIYLIIILNDLCR